MIKAAFIALLCHLVIAFNNPPDVKTWCGKAYEAKDAAFDPGGWLEEPQQSSIALLDLRVRPRMSLYTADDVYGSFIVDAALSFTNGQPYHPATIRHNELRNVSKPKEKLVVNIVDAKTGQKLISNADMTLNTTSNELAFSLKTLEPSLLPYMIRLKVKPADSRHEYEAETQLYRLPPNPTGGSTVKIDSLNGGIRVPDPMINPTSFKPLFPYGYYVGWGESLESHLVDIASFKQAGYNIIHIVPGINLLGFDFIAFNRFLDECERVGLWVMYDMRRWCS